LFKSSRYGVPRLKNRADAGKPAILADDPVTRSTGFGVRVNFTRYGTFEP
jgi:hypothetical protein